MATLPDLGTYLAANVTDTGLTLGTNLLLGRMPDSPDTCVVVYETSGPPPNETFGDSIPPIESVGIAVHVRAASYASAQSLVLDCFKQLTKITNETLSGTLYLHCEPQNSPFPLERDSQDRMVFIANLIAVKAL
tara:strand:- start:1078 stop:1479 length:402 start_codon:yes stop_codon:yes gene_type:complete